ncbi:unnamed protein product [Closterium sp. Yama58-4]|nr:unnamed protein product [Closterium sp. Yama58-4]
MADVAAPSSDINASAGDVDSRSGCRICAAVTATTVGGMREQMAQAKAAGADTAELRVDHLTEFDPSVDLPELLNDRCLPVIVTCRPTWEGGKYTDKDEAKRQQVLAMAMDMGAEFIDVELQVASEFIQKHVAPRRAAAGGAGVTSTRVIVSSHNYSVTPPLEELRALVARIEAAGADIVKFATTATDITDNARVFQILKEAQRPTIALVMGPKGSISRLLAPKFNAFLTFGAITPGAESAPGQPTVAELAGTYRLAGVGPATRVFGLVGNPVGHSKGFVLHNAALRHVGYDGVYVPFFVDDVPAFLKAFSDPDLKGFSVTIPHKLAALECCQDVEPLAKSIGAANTIIRGEGGLLKGYNTDCMAAIEAIEDGLRQIEGGSSNTTSSSSSAGSSSSGSAEASSSPLAGRLFVVVGAGGAGRALAFGAKARGADVIITNRSYGKAEALAAAVGGTAVPLPSGSGDADVAAGGDELAAGGSELAAVLQEMQRGRSGRAVLANTTSVGMHPHVDDTPVSKAVLQECSLVFDAVYTPMETRLLKEAKQAGAATVSGVEMFVGQAARQFELFTGKPAPVSLMREVVLASLSSRVLPLSATFPPPSSRSPRIMEAEEPPRARTLRNAAKRWSVPAVLHPASGRLVPMDDWAISAAVAAHSDGAPAAPSAASSSHDDFLKNLTNRSRKWIGGARSSGRPGTSSFRDADNAAAAAASPGAAPAAPPSLSNVPDPVLLKILMRVESPRDRASCAQVSPRWFWLEKRSRRAVTHLDLSQPSRFLESLPLAFFPRVTSLALNCALYRRACSADRLYDARELHVLELLHLKRILNQRPWENLEFVDSHFLLEGLPKTGMGVGVSMLAVQLQLPVLRPRLLQLRSLILEGGRNVTNIENIAKEISIKLLTQELAQCSALRHLVISQTVKGNPRLLERAFSSLPLLTYLDLGNLKIETPGAAGPPLLGATDGMLREVARWCAVLQEVYVGPHATVVGVEAVAGKCKQLRVLGDVTAACRDSMHVMNKWATNETLEEVGSSCPSLRSLLIRCNADITDAGLVALAALNPNLTHLNVFALAHSLTYISLVSAARHWTSLETLILPFCERDDRADLPDLVKVLSSSCPKLKVFSIGLCAHRYFEALLELLGSCPSLEYVYLYESCQEGHEFTMADLRKAAAKEKRKPLICYAAGSAEGI